MTSTPAPGRATPALLLAAVLAVAAAIAWLLLANGNLAPAPEAAAPGDPSTPSPITPVPTATTAPPTPTRTAAAADPVAFVVIDAEQKTPLPGAALHRLDTGALVATADAAGRCRLATAPDTLLVAVAADHLLRLCPSPTTTAGQPLPLRRDSMSLRVGFRLQGLDDAARGPVHARFRLLQALPRGPGPTAELQRAFTEHDMLAALPQLAFLGVLSSRAVVADCQIGSGATLRFCCAGRFELEVATDSGLAARRQFDLDADANDMVVEVALERAVFASGTVVRDGDGQPLAAVQVQASDGDPLHLVASTDATGAFRLGPLPPGPWTLSLRGPGLASASRGPFAGHVDGLRIAMQALTADAWHGRVCARPGGEPLAAAEVLRVDANGASAAGRTDQSGDFALPASASGPARLSITARGYLRYEALVTGPSEPLVCRLWPADAASRLAAHATALLRGIAVDARGMPLPGVPVRFVPATAAPPDAPDRPLLEGNLVLPQLVITAADGSFAIETRAFGPGQLMLLHGTVAPIPLRLDVRGGTAHDGLLLRAP